MRHYVGIDLGTTNSAICLFDGRQTTVLKSPEQADVTPSAIYVDRRGHTYYGRKAFELAGKKPENAAVLFKRYLGTGKSFLLEDSKTSLSPVECSAQLLKVLFGYLPEEVRNDPETVTVITVPAAFNQMKKDATLEAARLAGIGATALMQEPVAAVMSVLKKEDTRKLFLIYDLGGGTFDISLARYVSGHVNLLAQGGREMCGGRDLDRKLYYQKVLPWLQEHFTLPADPDGEEKYIQVKQALLFAIEQAKIALSSAEETTLWVDEDTLQTEDEEGNALYVDLPLTREDLAQPVSDMAAQTVELTKETIYRGGVSLEQIDQIVFVGGPTMYAPLREEVCALLGVRRGVAVNPMTAVAEGAAVYAESINWETDKHQRKSSFGTLAQIDTVRVRCEQRVSSPRGKVAVVVEDGRMRVARITSQPDQEGTIPYDSGRVSVIGQGILEVPLPKPGRYSFVLTVVDEHGKESIPPMELSITRTLASVESIPASHSIAVKALDRPGGKPVPIYLVEAGDPLPKSGSVTFRAANQLVGGSDGALRFTLWEGEIADPVDDNRCIGAYRIPGNSFSNGVIGVGTQIVCDYEMNEAGNLRLGVGVPSIGLRMQDQNFYSRYEGQTDLKDTSSLIAEVNKLLERTAQMKVAVVDDELMALRSRLFAVRETLSHSIDPESIAGAESDLLDCYRKCANLHQRYASVMRSHDLQRVLERFGQVEKDATQDEIASFRNLEDAARYSIDMGSSDFEGQLEEMTRRIARIRWRQDDTVRMAFLSLTVYPGDYSNRPAFDRLKAQGMTCLENRDMNGLRQVVNDLLEIRKPKSEVPTDHMFDEVDIYR